MMNVVPVNYAAVFAAAVLSMIIGYVWYGPLFGKAWMEEIGMSKSEMDKAQKAGMAKSYGLMFVGSLVMAWVLANAIVFAGAYTQMTGLSAGLMSAFFNWLGFIVPVMLSGVLWEKKSWRLWGLQSGYYLVTLFAMGALLAVWR